MTGENTIFDFNSFKFVQDCFINLDMVDVGECSMGALKK